MSLPYPQTNCDQQLHSLYMWLIFYPSPWLIHVPIMTLMPTSQMEVRGQGTTNTILLQDARNLTGVPKMVIQPAQHQAFPLKARFFLLLFQKDKSSIRSYQKFIIAFMYLSPSNQSYPNND